MEKWKKRSIDLMTSLVFGSRGDPTVVSYYPQKTKISMPEESFFKRSTPERHGISSKRIYNMLCELEAERRANMHNLMILCDGEVISECSSDGYDVNLWHISHSMSKTVCGMVIGTIVDEGGLHVDEKIIDIFSEMQHKDKRFSQITVEHLLSMTSGVDFAEPGSVTEKNWTEAFFTSMVRFVPGTKFAYNSMNTYILARIAERITGKSFDELVRERIFKPLGITNYFWEMGPEGTEKGGWGLYLSAESWAKIGYMVLCDGNFLGRRILSKNWVCMSSTVKAIAPEFNGNFNYAYQMWTARNNDEILFNGMLGQNVWICPKNRLVVVMQSGNNELFQASSALEIIRKYLGCSIQDRLDRKDYKILQEKENMFFEYRKWVRPKERNRGILCWLGIRPRYTFDTDWNNMLGNYAFASNNVGILPLIVRAMQNSLNSEIEEMTISREGDDLYLSIVEGGENIRIRVGLYGYESGILNIRGEQYIVRALGEVEKTRNGENLYKIELIFPETASTRRLVIKQQSKGIINLQFSEVPNNRIVEGLLSRYSETSSTIGFAVDLLERRLGDGVVAATIDKKFNPVLVGANREYPEWNKIIDKENKRISEESKRVRLIRALVDRFFKENTEGDQGEEVQKMKKKKGSFFFQINNKK